MTTKDSMLLGSLALNLGLAAALMLPWRSPAPKPAPAVEQASMPYQHLALTPEQRRILDDERDRFHAGLAAQEDHIRGRQVELLDLVAAPQPDRRAIADVQAQIRQQQAEVQQQVIEHLLHILAALPPDQRPQFLRHLKEKMALAGPLCPHEE